MVLDMYICQDWEEITVKNYCNMEVFDVSIKELNNNLDYIRYEIC